MKRFLLVSVAALSLSTSMAHADMEKSVHDAKEILCNSLTVVIKAHDNLAIRGAIRILRDDWAATADHDMTEQEMLSIVLYCGMHREATLDQAVEDVFEILK